MPSASHNVLTKHSLHDSTSFIMDQQLSNAGAAGDHELVGGNQEVIPVSIQCSLCFEDTESAQCKLINGNRVCSECVQSFIIPKFEAALQHEFAYPVEWNLDQVLNPYDFAEELGSDFIERFEQIEKEYLTPPNERVFCTALIYAEHVPPRGKSVVPSSRANGYTKPMPSTKADVERAIEEGREMLQCGGMACRRKPIFDEFGTRCMFITLPRCYRCTFLICTRCGEPAISPTRWGTTHVHGSQLIPRKLWKDCNEESILPNLPQSIMQRHSIATLGLQSHTSPPL